MGIAVVSGPAGDDDDIGLRLRLVVESDRLLLAHVIRPAQDLLEGGAHQEDGRGVACVLRRPGDEQAVEQLDSILRAEDTGIDEAIVSNAHHPPERKRWRLHGCRLRSRTRLPFGDGRLARPARTGGASSSSISNTADSRSSAMRLPSTGRARPTAPAVAELSSSA